MTRKRMMTIAMLVMLASTEAAAQSAADDTSPPNEDSQPARDTEATEQAPPDAERTDPAEGGDTTKPSAEEIEALEKELAEIRDAERGTDAKPQDAGTSATAARSAAGDWLQELSNAFNPAISLNAVFTAGYSSRPAEEEEAATTSGDAHAAGVDNLRSGIALQEIELRLSAVVDPYFRLDASIAGDTEDIAFEEAYLTTLFLPVVNFRVGQFFANLGRHQQLHTHAYPFLTGPQPWRTLLGREGLRAPGISADVLLPLPFFTEVNLQGFRSDWRPWQGSIADDPTTAIDESVPDQRGDLDLVYLAHLKTLFELAATTTLEVGGTYAGGRNGYGGWTSLVGADLTLKWRPLAQARYTSLEWTTEYLFTSRGGAPEDARVGGLYSALRYQFLQRWWVQARGALLGLPVTDEGRTWRAEALLAFVPSEFSTIRLQYAFERPGLAADPAVHEVFLQAVASIGSHPAHAY